jgi:hypothetical protein
VVQNRLSHSVAFCGAWIVAGGAGILLPTLPAVFNQTSPLFLFGLGALVSLYPLVVSAVCLAFFQYVLLSVLVGRVSKAVLLWIPVSAMAAIVFPTVLSALTSNLRLLSFGAMNEALPQGIPLIVVMGSLLGFAYAVCVGLGQGIVLSLIYRRELIDRWILANLFAAVPAGIVMAAGAYGIRDEATAAYGYFMVTLFSAVLYAAVTGPALLWVVGHKIDGNALAPSRASARTA